VTRSATTGLSPSRRYVIFMARSDRTSELSLTGHPSCRAIPREPAYCETGRPYLRRASGLGMALLQTAGRAWFGNEGVTGDGGDAMAADQNGAFKGRHFRAR
jgi:hypothetical protein